MPCDVSLTVSNNKYRFLIIPVQCVEKLKIKTKLSTSKYIFYLSIFAKRKPLNYAFSCFLVKKKKKV